MKLFKMSAILIFSTIQLLTAETQENKEGNNRSHNVARVKQEFQLSEEDLSKGELELNGGPMGPKSAERDPDRIYYSGNPGLLDLLRRVEFRRVDSINLKDVTLLELANTVNSSIPAASRWKFIVSDDAKEIRVSGILDKNIVLSLTRLMHQEKFYCRITNGIVEFKKGARSPFERPFLESK